MTTYLGEITPLDPRPSALGGRRINLIVPSLNSAHYFGGIHTAVELFLAFTSGFDRARIVILDSAPDDTVAKRFPDWIVCEPVRDCDARRVIVPMNDRYLKTLPVCAGDVWMATAWWTAYAAHGLVRWMRGYYGAVPRLLYLIQDFEPGFYAWSSQSLLALNTYRPADDIAIFNSSMLRDYFHQAGIRYHRAVVFEPALNERLRKRCSVGLGAQRDRIIVAYARPSTPRNAYPLLCEALRVWAWRFWNAAQWRVVAVGELATDEDLGPLRLEAQGKLDIDAYGELLSRAAVGFSLMVSPHPSYPPLEMAAMGMAVVTNSYGPKQLGRWFDNIVSVDDPRPESLGAALVTECARWEQAGMQRPIVVPKDHFYLRESAFGDVAAQVLALLGAA